MLNFVFNLILLFSVSVILRRKTKVFRLILSSLAASTSIFILFLSISSFELFIIKVLISLIMVLIAFGYRDLRYMIRNLFYLYTSSMILGGFLYFLNIQFAYKQEGLVFYHNGLSINFIFLIITSPIIIYTYVKQSKFLKNNYNHYYNLKVHIKGETIKLTGFLDTGHQVKDPYADRPIILINKNKIPTLNKSFVYIPYHTIDHHQLLKCLIIDEVEIDKIGIKKKVLFGLIDEELSIDGVDCLIGSKLLEE